VSASEAGPEQAFDQSLVKQITGRDKVIARFLYKEFTEFTPQFKIFLAANFRPKITGDEALWNRIHVVPFSKRIPKERQDKNLEARLRKELPGILSWAVMGCKNWLEDESLKPSDSVREALKVYRAEADVVQGFIDKHCDVDEMAFVAFGDLYEKWTQYAEKKKADPGTKKAFAILLNENGFKDELKNIGGNPTRIRLGLKLRTSTRPRLSL
jgi:putative DNA primase/helicase